MLIEQRFTLDAPRDEVAKFFLDIDRVAGCIPGVEGVEEVGPHQYTAVLAIRLGPIRAAFAGALELDDREAPGRFVATGEGRDKATGSLAKVTFTADLEDVSGLQTEVAAVADLSLRGRMAQFGTGVVRAAAGEIVREFAARANDALDQRSEVPGTAAAPAPTSSRGLLRVVGRGLVDSLLRTLRGWFGPRRDPADRREPADGGAPR
ncbi:MAG TPA: SRPBCC domain-containing protein [Nocardioidaceae bacterium]|nr:SRPBCC domain-containing protein [Nocardioidaceae bacterium]